jgi:flagellar hook assembly protein FlgD
VALRPGSPNPFARSTSIRFDMPSAGAAELTVHDVAGRLVKRLVRGRLPAGTHLTVWDGADEQGVRVPGGVYFARLRVDDALRSSRIVFIGR